MHYRKIPFTKYFDVVEHISFKMTSEIPQLLERNTLFKSLQIFLAGLPSWVRFGIREGSRNLVTRLKGQKQVVQGKTSSYKCYFFVKDL